MIGRIDLGEVVLSYENVPQPILMGDIKDDFDTFYTETGESIDRIVLWPHQHAWMIKQVKAEAYEGRVNPDFERGLKLWGIPLTLLEVE